MQGIMASVDQVAKYWWVLAIRGLLAIAFGIAAIAWPGLALLTLIYMWGFYMLTSGVMEVIAGMSTRWWSMVFLGALSVAAGVIAFVWPGATALTLLYIIAAAAIIRGVMEIVAAIQLRKVIENEFWLALGGVASIAFGLLLSAFPGAGALSLVLYIGIFAIVVGIVSIAVALRIRSLGAARGAVVAS
jgi:uncharacterized membrane protein HdeD (DUF308 family)